MGKNPIADREFLDFQYPAPLNAPQREGETAIQYENRLAAIDPDEVDEGHWVKFRVPRSRADVDAVADYSQSIVDLGGGNVGGNNGGGMHLEQRIGRANRGVFELLVDGWSFEDKFGLKATGVNYGKLDLWAGDWIVSCLAAVGEAGTKRDYPKAKPSSSAEPKTSRAKSSSAAS